VPHPGFPDGPGDPATRKSKLPELDGHVRCPRSIQIACGRPGVQNSLNRPDSDPARHASRSAVQQRPGHLDVQEFEKASQLAIEFAADFRDLRYAEAPELGAWLIESEPAVTIGVLCRAKTRLASAEASTPPGRGRRSGAEDQPQRDVPPPRPGSITPGGNPSGFVCAYRDTRSGVLTKRSLSTRMPAAQCE
jgi:hypothetical protein